MQTEFSFKGLDTDNELELQTLFTTLADKTERNMLKNKYYDMKNRLKDMGIAIPPQLKGFGAVVGWPKKAVDALANRSIFEGFVHEDEDSNAALAGILEQNRFDLLNRQATRSELIHSCSFLTISKGDPDTGEPEVIISAYSAEHAAAIWDSRNKRLKAGMTVTERGTVSGNDQEPVRIYYYTDTHVHDLTREGNTWALVESHKHTMGRPLMEVLAYDATIDRPFGRSRINRAVISICDSAMRASLRAEVASEFFTTPQRYIMGADEDLFSNKSPVEAYMGWMLAITKNSDGEDPKVGQFEPMSMRPHIEYLSGLAARFAGETSLPISSLGIVQDNPASAEAIYASKEDLIIEAQNLNRSNGPALKNLSYMILAILQERSFAEIVREQGSRITVKFKSPAMPSIVSQSDAMVKQVSAIPWIAETRVALEELGYDESQIARLLSDKRRAVGASTLRELMGAQSAYTEE